MMKRSAKSVLNLHFLSRQPDQSSAQQVPPSVSPRVSNLIAMHSVVISMNQKSNTGELFNRYSQIKKQLLVDIQPSSDDRLKKLNDHISDIASLITEMGKLGHPKSIKPLLAKAWYLSACCQFYALMESDFISHTEPVKALFALRTAIIIYGFEDKLNVQATMQSYSSAATNYLRLSRMIDLKSAATNALRLKRFIELKKEPTDDRDDLRKIACENHSLYTREDFLITGFPEQAEKFLYHALDVDTSYASTRLYSPR